MRRRWSLYVMLLLIGVSGVALLMLLLTQLDAPAHSGRGEPRSSSVPSAIR